MEQNFQDETQKSIQKNNLDYFAAHFAKKTTQKRAHYNVMRLRLLR